MKTIYIDSNFKCHITNPEEQYTAIETDAFDGKCDTYIEGYRFIPSNSAWIRPDGTIFYGEMVAPWKPWAELDKAQGDYEREQYFLLSAQNTELLDAMASMVDEVYEQDIETIGGE